MSILQDWAAGMCGVAIGCAVLSMLCPAGAMRRVFGILTAVLFLSCLLSPVKMLAKSAVELFKISEGTEVPSVLNEQVDEQVQAVLTQVLLRDATERVGEMATVKNLVLCRDNMQDNRISIERIRVTLDCEDMAVASNVRSVLEKAWGVPVEVYYAR